MTVIDLTSDLRVTTYAPPAGADPATADPADAVRWGFPPRPEDPRHQARYDQVFNRLRGKLNYITPTLRRNVEKFHGPRQRIAADGTETSNNWSGAVVAAPAGQSFKWLQGDWVVPDVDAPTENQWYYSSSWIGIDGDGSGDVCQAGVECEAYRSGTSVTRNIYPWFEWYPESEIQITNLAVSPGDMVTLLLCTASGAGSTSASFYFTNRTTGATTSLSFSAPAGTQLVGNCAEWIVEAPTVGGQQSAIADYGEVFFSVCEAVTTTGVTVDGGTGDNINLTSGSTTVSDGNLITASVVQCEYVGTLP